MKHLFGLLFLALFATLFTPELTIDEEGTPDIQIVQEAFADDPDPKPKNPNPEPKPKNPKQPGKKDEEDEDDPEPEPKDDPEPEPSPKHHGPKDDPDPEPKKKDFNADEYVSKDEYNELKSQMQDLTEARQQEVVQRRVDHAINEEYIDGDDDEQVEKVRKIAGNDETWEAFKDVAKPNVPGHIAAQRFQRENLKTNKFSGDNDILDKVHEHQQA